jgi:hypothetical protein
VVQGDGYLAAGLIDPLADFRGLIYSDAGGYYDGGRDYDACK